jgi:multidrug efflux pump subunit AcrA (membrane-fusion protein)
LSAGELRDQQTLQKDTDAIASAQTAQAQGIAKDNQSIKNAQQQLTNAGLSLQSTENSNAQKTAPPLASDVQTSQASVEQAQAQVDTAQQALDATALTAPADGTVGAVNDTVGETVSSGNTGNSTTAAATTTTSSSSSSGFLTLTDLTSLQIVANIDEADASKVTVGVPAITTLNALPGKQFASHVIAVANSSTVSNNVVQYQVTLALDTTDATIKPGMTASVSVTTAKADGVLNVTSAAVRTAAGVSYLLVVQPDGTQKQVNVVVGLKGNTTTEVSGAVKAGDTVVLPATTVTRSTANPSANAPVGGQAGLGGGAVFGGGGAVGGTRGGG